jgi:hypothetical protein
MSNIDGVSLINISQLDIKTQNQTATAGITDFAGVLEQNGVPVATTTTIGSYLPLAGGTMTGTINMNTHPITNVTFESLINTASVATPASGLVSLFSNTSGVLSTTNSSGSTLTYATTGDVSNYLPLAGGTMSGNIDMGVNELKNDLTVEFFQQNSVPAPSAGFSKIWVNTSSQLSIKDSTNIPASILQNDGAVPMLAGFNFNTNPLLLCGHIETNNSNVNIGLASAVSGSDDVVIGSSASITSGNSNVCIGHGAVCGGNADTLLGENTATPAGGAANIVIGSSAQVVGAGLTSNTIIGTGSVSNAGGCLIIGENSSCAVTCFNTTMIGYQSTSDGVGTFAMGGQCVSTGDRAHILCGDNVTNAIPDSCLLGNTSITNFRPASTVCDLGTTLLPFASARVGALRLVTGANTTVGSGAVMVGGTVTVNTSAVNTGDVVLLSRTALGGVTGQAYISAIVDVTSFTITSSNVADTSTFSWVIIKQA